MYFQERDNFHGKANANKRNKVGPGKRDSRIKGFRILDNKRSTEAAGKLKDSREQSTACAKVVCK